MANFVYIATSLDGFIADKDDGLGWLEMVPNPNNEDMGWADFMGGIDALVMGRRTFETVCGFGGPWPYDKPVFVLSASLKALPEGYEDKAELVSGPLPAVVADLEKRGFRHLYIDGGKTIQSFLREDLIDELIITRLPILLGGGASLFGDLAKPLSWSLVGSQSLLGEMVQSHYRRTR
ncbi:MAG: dihydrofolate reductase family protein [Cohaesibacter sp.]|jgi:dihydrofolate reductase|nr:dihydrofolate reductase family protein [Cohaesibacter sp.]